MPRPLADPEDTHRWAVKAIATRIMNQYAAILSDAERALVASMASTTSLNLHLTKLVALEGALQTRQ